MSSNFFSRADGRSVVAAAAYRTAMILHDEKLSVNWDYTRKEHVVFSEIMASDNALSWVKDREVLWQNENLEASSGIASRTLASHLYYWDRGS